MDSTQVHATLTVALMAAFVDGLNDEREREAVKKVAETLGGESGLDLTALYGEVLLKKPDLAQVAAALTTPEARQFAYEMAVSVCHADGEPNAAELDFLQRLATALKLPAETAGAAHADAAAVAGAAGAAMPPPVSGTVLGAPSISQAEIDQLVLKAAVTNAALELLPGSLATLAIIPLQLRLVYQIGKAYGYEMNRVHAQDFLATLGVGITSQYVEQIGRKMLGGILGAVGGGLGRVLGREAGGSGIAFVTTYAIGRVAQRYYASGRTLDAAALKATFSDLLGEARSLAPQYRQQIEQTAGTIDTRSLAALVQDL